MIGFCHCGDEATQIINNGEPVCGHPTCIAYSLTVSGVLRRRATTRYHLTADEAHAVWDVLIAKAGASDHEEDRYPFIAYLTDDQEHGHEYRFMGNLGFGGKLHFNWFHGAWVDCYPEHVNDERSAIIAAINEELARIVPSQSHA